MKWRLPSRTPSEHCLMAVLVHGHRLTPTSPLPYLGPHLCRPPWLPSSSSTLLVPALRQAPGTGDANTNGYFMPACQLPVGHGTRCYLLFLSRLHRRGAWGSCEQAVPAISSPAGFVGQNTV